MEIENKLNNLKKHLKELESVAVAYSGGVDSTFLLKIARDVLGDNVIAVTARSSTYPAREFREAADFVLQAGIKHVVVSSEELDIAGFADNPLDRCYYCKRELLAKLIAERAVTISYCKDRMLMTLVITDRGGKPSKNWVWAVL